MPEKPRHHWHKTCVVTCVSDITNPGTSCSSISKRQAMQYNSPPQQHTPCMGKTLTAARPHTNAEKNEEKKNHPMVHEIKIKFCETC